MKNLISKKTLSNILLGTAVLVFFSLASCESNSYVNPQEYLDEEDALLQEFYETIIDTVNNEPRTWLEKTAAEAVDTIDRRQTTGMMLFHTKIGEGDSVKIYKRVGFRYTQYQILADTLDQPGLYYYLKYRNSFPLPAL